MNILGIFNGNNAAAALIRDDLIVSAIQEERLARIKNYRGYPHGAIQKVLEESGLKFEDVDAVVCGSWSYPPEEAVVDYFDSAESIGKSLASARLYNSMKSDHKYMSEFFINSARLFPEAEIKVYDHHLSHAASTFFASGFEESYALTMDGRGELQSTVLWKVDKTHGFRRVKTVSELNSLGAMYGQITGLLGFKPDRHEGKITGLAAYGKETNFAHELEKLIRFEDESIVAKKHFVPFLTHDYTYLKEITQDMLREDIAYAAQYVLEKIVVEFVNKHVPAGANLCIAGGVAANVKLNQRIREQTKISNYFVFPEMSDAGHAVGSAFLYAHEKGIRKFHFKDMYLGPSFGFENVDLDGYNVVTFDDMDMISDEIVKHVIDNKIIGIFTGNMEYGPRALGSRSIVMSASDPNINAVVNKRLNRTEFMPFAPVTLESEAPGMYIDYEPSDTNTRFMTTCYACTETMKSMSPAVVHIDGTARPQIINEHNTNPLYFKVLNAYYAKTKIPNLVNTSFNNHEEPIVCTPEDALESLKKGNVDYIATDKMLISKLNNS